MVNHVQRQQPTPKGSAVTNSPEHATFDEEMAKELKVSMFHIPKFAKGDLRTQYFKRYIVHCLSIYKITNPIFPLEWKLRKSKAQ